MPFSRHRRALRGDYAMIFSFATVGCVSVSRGSGRVSSSFVNAHNARQCVVNLTGVANAQTVTVALNNVNGSIGDHSDTLSASMDVLLGDVNGHAVVNSTDATLTKSAFSKTVTLSNFR